jgi:hypothetical protein
MELEAKTLTFENFDKFQRQPYANRLTTVIRNFSPFYDEAFVLSLNSKYGGGKTTFLKMWKNQLEEEGHKVIYINAWETDFDNEPLIPIISALLDNIDTRKDSKKLKSALQGTLGAAALASNNLLSHATGLNINDIMKEVRTDLKARDIQELGEDLYKEYSYKKTAYKSLREELSKYIESIEKKPLIIFVDELDRVRPDYSVRFLEAIKHIFCLKGVCFVIAVDRKQLEVSVKQLYGEIDFENYYLRFITREANLPETTKTDLKAFIEHQGVQFFDQKQEQKIQFPFKSNDKNKVLNFIEVICRAFEFTPRQIESLFRCFSQVMAVSKVDKIAKASWVDAAIILCALFIKNREVYQKIGTGVMPVSELHKYFKDLEYTYPPHNYNQRYIVLTVLSCYMREDENLLQEIADIGLQYNGREKVKKDSEDYEELRKREIYTLAKVADDMGRIYDQSPFQYIYKIMEEWREFIV